LESVEKKEIALKKMLSTVLKDKEKIEQTIEELDSAGKLRERSIGLGGVLFQSITGMGPATVGLRGFSLFLSSHPAAAMASGARSHSIVSFFIISRRYRTHVAYRAPAGLVPFIGRVGRRLYCRSKRGGEAWGA